MFYFVEDLVLSFAACLEKKQLLGGNSRKKKSKMCTTDCSIKYQEKNVWEIAWNNIVSSWQHF